MADNTIERPLITIIVAIYNSMPYLRKCIISIMKQDYDNLQIILVDDGSPDDSPELCDSFAASDDRIRVIHKINGGTCSARNAGLEAAEGDYVIFVDGDDWLESDHVSYMLSLIQNQGLDMAMGYNIFTTRDREQVKEDSIEIVTGEEAVELLLYPIIPIGPWNKIYSRVMLNENDLTFSVPWSGEGLFFSTMAAQYAGSVGTGKRKTYNYRLNNASSGLTNYNVQLGINALNNIKYIQSNLRINTQRTRRAADWHIWKNYGYLLFLIVATSSRRENHELVIECRRGLITNLFPALDNNFFGATDRVKMIAKTIMPVTLSKYRLARERRELAKDLENGDSDERYASS